jgi:hypothetical protein
MVASNRSDTSEIRYVIQDNLTGHYEQDDCSPVRIIPPYGTEVRILEKGTDWTRIEAFRKSAWVRTDGLALNPPPERPKSQVSIVNEQSQIPNIAYTQISHIEYGPRGGRYTRTKTGYRRYF